MRLTIMNRSPKPKKVTSLEYGIVAMLIVVLAPIAISLIAPQLLPGKTAPIIILLGALILVVLSYFQYKHLTNGQKYPLFVPKLYGFGLGINPNHPIGKLLWIVIFLLLLFFLMTAIF